MFDKVTEKDILISLWVNLNKQFAHNLHFKDSVNEIVLMIGDVYNIL